MKALSILFKVAYKFILFMQSVLSEEDRADFSITDFGVSTVGVQVELRS